MPQEPLWRASRARVRSSISKEPPQKAPTARSMADAGGFDETAWSLSRRLDLPDATGAHACRCSPHNLGVARSRP